MSGKPVGTMFVELDLDASRYTKGQQKLLRDAQSASLNIEQNFRNLGIKSSAEMDLMRAKIKNSYDMIANNSKATANDILRAERAKNEQLEALNRKQFGEQSNFIDNLKEKWLGLTAGAAAAAYASMRAVGQAIDMAEVGSKLQKQSAAFDNLARSAGTSASSMLTELKRVSAGMVAEADLITAAGKALLMGLNPGEITRLMEIAAATSKSTGQTITEAFADITMGVARQSKMILDNLGIIVDVDRANREYAKSLGKTAEALSDAEKRQAFMNSVMKSGEDMIKRIGSSAGALDNVNKLVAAQANLWNEVNKTVATFLDEELSGYVKVIGWLDEKLKGLRAAKGEVTRSDLLKEIEMLRSLEAKGMAQPGSAAAREAEFNRRYLQPQFGLKPSEELKRTGSWSTPAWNVADWKQREGQWVDFTEAELKAMAEQRDKIIKAYYDNAGKIKQAQVDVWKGWGVRPYTESEAFLADEKAASEFRARWSGYGQRPYQESESVLADQAAWEAWKKNGETSMSAMVQLSERTADAMEQNFSDLFFDMWKGELNSAEDYFRAFSDSIGRMAADMAGQMLKTGLFGASQPGQPVGGLFGALAGYFTGSARGNVFGPGGVVPFRSGGVVSRPTVFPFARGIGLMGEAGPEAILPLKRGAGGRLGVEASGGGTQVIVNNYGQDRASVKETSGPGNSRQIFVTIGQDIAAGGPIAQAIESTYRIRRAGRIA